MALGTLWVFGDSFDYGTEVSRKGEIYHDKYKKSGDSHYSLHIGKELKLEVRNNAKPSFGPYHTLYQLTKKIHEIKPEDYVIVGVSDVNRILGFQKNSIPSENPEIPDPNNMIDVYGYWSREDSYMTDKMKYLSDNYFNYVTDYIVNCMQPFVGEHFYFVNQIFNNLLLTINCKKTFIYNINLWTKFETIKEATDNQINDMHWSYKGNKDFAKYVVEIWNSHKNYSEPTGEFEKKYREDAIPPIFWSPDDPDPDPYNSPKGIL